MIVVDRRPGEARPKINGVSLESIVAEGASDSCNASQKLIIELAGQGAALVQRLAREGASENDVRLMLRFLYDARLAKRPVAIAYRFRDAMACDFVIECDDETNPPFSVVYPDETPVVFYDSQVTVHCGNERAFKTIAYSIFPFIDPETSDTFHVSKRNDQFVFGDQAEWCDIDLYLPVATTLTIEPSGIDARHVDIRRGSHSFVIRNRAGGASIKASLCVPEGDVAFLREFDPQWLDRFEPPSMKSAEWAHSVERGVFVADGDLMQFPGMTPDFMRNRMRRAVHRAHQIIEEIAIWSFLSPEETKLAEIARIDGVWRALSPFGGQSDDGEIIYLAMTTDIVRFALELEERGCALIHPPIITEMNILFSAKTKDGSEIAFLIPIDDGRFTWS